MTYRTTRERLDCLRALLELPDVAAACRADADPPSDSAFQTWFFSRTRVHQPCRSALLSHARTLITAGAGKHARVDGPTGRR